MRWWWSTALFFPTRFLMSVCKKKSSYNPERWVLLATHQKKRLVAYWFSHFYLDYVIFMSEKLNFKSREKEIFTSNTITKGCLEFLAYILTFQLFPPILPILFSVHNWVNVTNYWDVNQTLWVNTMPILLLQSTVVKSILDQRIMNWMKSNHELNT